MSKGPKISPKMKKGIKACEEILSVKFTGKTFEEASKFLEENMPKIQGKDIRDFREPSDKMWKGISFITQMTGEEFKGETMKDASIFIDKYMEKASKMKKERSNG